jgi:hypothetical protein
VPWRRSLPRPAAHSALRFRALKKGEAPFTGGR